MWCPKRLGNLVTHPTILSLQGELLLAVRFILGTEQCWPGGWDDTVKMKLFFLPHFGYSQISCSTVLLKFLKWAPELSQRAVFVCEQLSNCLYLVGGGDGGLLLYHLADVTPLKL